MVDWGKVLEKMEDRTGKKQIEGLYENAKLQHLIYVHEKTENDIIRYEHCDATYVIHEMTIAEFRDYSRIY